MKNIKNMILPVALLIATSTVGFAQNRNTSENPKQNYSNTDYRHDCKGRNYGDGYGCNRHGYGDYGHDGHDGYGHDGYGHDGYGHDGYGHDGYGHDGYDKGDSNGRDSNQYNERD